MSCCGNHLRVRCCRITLSTKFSRKLVYRKGLFNFSRRHRTKWSQCVIPCSVIATLPAFITRAAHQYSRSYGKISRIKSTLTDHIRVSSAKLVGKTSICIIHRQMFGMALFSRCVVRSSIKDRSVLLCLVHTFLDHCGKRRVSRSSYWKKCANSKLVILWSGLILLDL